MTIFNRRNAALGWLVWMFGKRFGKKKARGTVPGKRRAASAAGGLAAVGGLFAALRRRRRRRTEGDGA